MTMLADDDADFVVVVLSSSSSSSPTMPPSPLICWIPGSHPLLLHYCGPDLVRLTRVPARGEAPRGRNEAPVNELHVGSLGLVWVLWLRIQTHCVPFVERAGSSPASGQSETIVMTDKSGPVQSEGIVSLGLGCSSFVSPPFGRCPETCLFLGFLFLPFRFFVRQWSCDEPACKRPGMMMVFPSSLSVLCWL